jgi:hypothetical protein
MEEVKKPKFISISYVPHNDTCIALDDTGKLWCLYDEPEGDFKWHSYGEFEFAKEEVK